MDDKLFEILDDLDIKDTDLLLDKDINLSVDYYTRKRIEKSVKKKAGYYSQNSMLIKKINNILGKISMKRNMGVALSVCAILILSGGSYVYAAKTPVAYVSVDINPSVEFGINTFDKVISVEAYNEDGKKILEDINLINYRVDNAVNTVVTNAISDGYIHDDGSSSIEITTATDKEEVASKLEKSLKDAAGATLNNNNIQAEVRTENVAIERRNEARQLGITSGKLNLIEKLQELDPSINIEDYKSSSVKEIKNKTKELNGNYNNDEATAEDSINYSTNQNKNENTNTDLSIGGKDTHENITNEKIDNSMNNNRNIKKEKNNNFNNKEKELNDVNNQEKETKTSSEKQNNNNDLNSQRNNNSNSQNKNSDKEKINNK